MTRANTQSLLLTYPPSDTGCLRGPSPGADSVCSSCKQHCHHHRGREHCGMRVGTEEGTAGQREAIHAAQTGTRGLNILYVWMTRPIHGQEQWCDSILKLNKWFQTAKLILYLHDEHLLLKSALNHKSYYNGARPFLSALTSKTNLQIHSRCGEPC